MSDVAVRKAPVDAVMAPHRPDARGKCRWCGKPVTDRTATHKLLKFWHDACETAYLICIRPDVARRAVFQRDKGICCDCGEDWSENFKLIPAYYLGEKWGGSISDRDKCLGPDGKRFVQVHHDEGHPYVALVAISLWHVDHKIPLWKVRHLPPLKRILYFLLPNLITRCHRCHERKTSKEHGERNKYDRLGTKPPDPGKKPKSKSKFGSRPMQSGKTKWPKREFPKRRK